MRTFLAYFIELRRNLMFGRYAVQGFGCDLPRIVDLNPKCKNKHNYSLNLHTLVSNLLMYYIHLRFYEVKVTRILFPRVGLTAYVDWSEFDPLNRISHDDLKCKSLRGAARLTRYSFKDNHKCKLGSVCWRRGA